MRRILSLITTAAASVAVLLAPAAAPAHAEGSCTVTTPGTVVVTGEVTPFSLSLADDCAQSRVWAASWDLVDARSGSTVRPVVFDGQATLALEWAVADGFGTFRLQPSGALDEQLEALTQNTASLTVKAASRASLVVTRNRSSVTVTAGASYFSARLGRQAPWDGAPVEIQAAVEPEGPWSTVATVTTGPDGLGEEALYAPSPRYWRVLTPSTRSVFPRYSVPVLQ